MSTPRRVVDGTRVEVAVVGGGQAGLSASWHLTQRGIDHVVLERDRIAHDWADRRWDAFTLVTPNWQCVLPGFPYDGDDPDGFMTRDQVLTWIRRYPATFDAPVIEGVLVTRLREAAAGGFEVVTDQGTLLADQVIIATGGYHRPVMPAAAAQVSPSIVPLRRLPLPRRPARRRRTRRRIRAVRGPDRRGPVPRRTPGPSGPRLRSPVCSLLPRAGLHRLAQ
jgi:glycine/D-amino acid oxidase-like deaminating enzyme